MKHYEGNYYHVYNRGCNRDQIFVSNENYAFLLRQLHNFLPDSAVSVIAYCLMPNHYHFLVRADSDNSVARLIQRLFNSYAQAFNRQQKRTGTLFEGRAKSIPVDNTDYLIYLCRYIHLNPVVSGLVPHPEDWQYSNYAEWIGERNSVICGGEFINSFFATPAAYRDFVQCGIPGALERKLTKYVIDEDPA